PKDQETLAYPTDFESIKRTHTPSRHAIARKKTPELKISSAAVLASVADFPRHHLGSMIYACYPKPKPGSSVHHDLLPRFEGRENCTFQVRIPWRFLTKEARMDATERREIW